MQFNDKQLNTSLFPTSILGLNHWIDLQHCNVIVIKHIIELQHLLSSLHRHKQSNILLLQMCAKTTLGIECQQTYLVNAFL